MSYRCYRSLPDGSSQCPGLTCSAGLWHFLVILICILIILLTTCVLNLVLNYVHICNSFSMDSPHVRNYNPRALASGLSYVQVDKHGVTILYHLVSVDLSHHEICRVQVGKDV